MLESTRNSKQKLRKELQKQRDLMTQDEVSERSLKITERIFELTQFQSAQVIHSYVPITSKNEVDSSLMMQKALEEGKRLVVPKVIAGNQLEHYQVESLDALVLNKWGIPEPAGGTRVSPSELDVIFVPMLAGDRFKNRLGFGKGFYDRLLIKTKAVKIGLLYHFQLFETLIPTEVFDIPLDMLVTDEAVVK